MKSPPTTLLTALLLIAPLALLGAPACADANPPARELDLVYRVTADGRDLGRIEVRLSHGASEHRVEALTRPEGVAKLFADNVTEQFTYLPAEDGWRARQYSEENGDADEAISMTFEYGDTLRASGSGDNTSHPPDSLVEPQGFPLSAFLLPAQALEGRDILMPTNRGLRRYRYTKQAEERVQVGGTSYDTIKWLKQRPDRDDRGFIIWSDKATRVPVRIEKFKQSGTMTMQIVPESLAAGP